MRNSYLGILLVASTLVAAGASRAGQHAASVRAEHLQGFGLYLAKPQPTSNTFKVGFEGKSY